MDLLTAKKIPKLGLRNAVVELSHGSGGQAMTQLIAQLFHREFDNEWLRQKQDQAIIAIPKANLAVTTDSYVISPLFFPGGDIGALAVHGTINDLAMAGAKPLYLTAAFILEEGFPLPDLQRIVASMGSAARSADVAIICGDTKVVERGKGDGVFINTTGIGVIDEDMSLSKQAVQVGDQLILSGFLGDHGIAILSQRNHLQFAANLQSDSAALHELVATMLQSKAQIKCMRDPTRGGLAAVLNEWATEQQIGFIINEEMIPVRPQVASACELLGLDVLNVANEGKLLAICAAADTDKLLAAMHGHPLGREAAVIGAVVEDERHLVELKTLMGGRRIIDWLTGEQLPRIC